MKTRLTILASIVIAFTCSQAHALQWQKKAIDMAVPAGTPEVRVEFPFKNTSKTSVHIKDVTTSCGCTTAAARVRDVAPGEEGIIYVTFTVGTRAGKQAKKIFVLTDEGPTPAELSLDMLLPAAPNASASRVAGE